MSLLDTLAWHSKSGKSKRTLGINKRCMLEQWIRRAHQWGGLSAQSPSQSPLMVFGHPLEWDWCFYLPLNNSRLARPWWSPQIMFPHSYFTVCLSIHFHSYAGWNVEPSNSSLERQCGLSQTLHAQQCSFQEAAASCVESCHQHPACWLFLQTAASWTMPSGP